MEAAISDVSDDGNDPPRDREEGEEEEEEEEEEVFGVEHSRDASQFYCEVCDCTNSSVQDLQLHFAGSRHKRKLEMAGLSIKLTRLVERPKNLDIWKTMVRCLLCKDIMLGCDCLIHAKCHTHQRKLGKMSGQRNRDFYTDISNCFKPIATSASFEESMGGGGDSGQFFCEPCKLELSSKEHLEIHVSGKKHSKRMRWLFISGDEESEREYRQIWCSLCRVFMNTVEGFDGHIRGRTHVKELKKAGVEWQLLVSAYGEDLVGSQLFPTPRHLSDRIDHAPSSGGIVKSESGENSHLARHSRDSNTSASRDRSRSRSPRHSSHAYHSSSAHDDSSPSPVSSRPSWKEAYSSIPDYHPGLPRSQVLREGKRHNTGRVIYQKPLLAIGEWVERLDVADPRLKEMEERVRTVTQERVVREREKEQREEEEEERGWRGYRGRGGRGGFRGGRGRGRGASRGGWREYRGGYGERTDLRRKLDDRSYRDRR